MIVFFQNQYHSSITYLPIQRFPYLSFPSWMMPVSTLWMWHRRRWETGEGEIIPVTVFAVAKQRMTWWWFETYLLFLSLENWR